MHRRGVEHLVLVNDRKQEKLEKERKAAEALASQNEAVQTKGERRKLEQIRRKKENQARVAGTDNSMHTYMKTSDHHGATELDTYAVFEGSCSFFVCGASELHTNRESTYISLERLSHALYVHNYHTYELAQTFISISDHHQVYESVSPSWKPNWFEAVVCEQKFHWTPET